MLATFSLASLGSNLDLWLALVVVYLLEKAGMSSRRAELRRLRCEAEEWCGGKGGGGKGSFLGQSTLFDFKDLSTPLKKFIGEDYFFSLYVTGACFQSLLREDLEVFMMMIRSLEGGYAFVLQVLRSFVFMGAMVGVLGFLVVGYNFRSMMAVLILVQLGYGAYVKLRLLNFLKEDLTHLRGAHGESSLSSRWYPFLGVLKHKQELTRMLSGFWQRRGNPTSVFALMSLQWVKEHRMKQELALFQIFGGALSMVFFLKDNFDYIFPS